MAASSTTFPRPDSAGVVDLVRSRDNFVSIRGNNEDKLIHDRKTLATLEEAGSIDYARETAREFVRSGKDQLAALPPGEARDLLEDIADYLVDRDH